MSAGIRPLTVHPARLMQLSPMTVSGRIVTLQPFITRFPTRIDFEVVLRPKIRSPPEWVTKVAPLMLQSLPIVTMDLSMNPANGEIVVLCPIFTFQIWTCFHLAYFDRSFQIALLGDKFIDPPSHFGWGAIFTVVKPNLEKLPDLIF